MPQLLNQFDLKPTVTREAFDTAWAAFAAYLIEADLAADVGPVLDRQPASGYDTDEDRVQSMLAVIRFADQAQADRAWTAIESHAAPLGSLHRAVFRLVHDPIFTFWDGA